MVQLSHSYMTAGKTIAYWHMVGFHKRSFSFLSSELKWCTFMILILTFTSFSLANYLFFSLETPWVHYAPAWSLPCSLPVWFIFVLLSPWFFRKFDLIQVKNLTSLNIFNDSFWPKDNADMASVWNSRSWNWFLPTFLAWNDVFLKTCSSGSQTSKKLTSELPVCSSSRNVLSLPVIIHSLTHSWQQYRSHAGPVGPWAQSLSVSPIFLIIGNSLHSASRSFPEFQRAGSNSC